jgi:hypothetical protein
LIVVAVQRRKLTFGGCKFFSLLGKLRFQIVKFLLSLRRRFFSFNLFQSNLRRGSRTPIHGYEVTREAAMAAFGKSWRRE